MDLTFLSMYVIINMYLKMSFLFEERRYIMGQFSWLDCKNNKQQILDDVAETSYVLVPKQFGGGHIEEKCYNGYGEFGGKDIYELVVDWNKEILPEIANRCENGEWVCNTSNEDVDNLRRYFMGQDITCEKRWLGIILACYDEDNFKLLYPIKITYDEDAVYENCSPSYSDPNQGWATEDDDWDEDWDDEYYDEDDDEDF